MVDNDLSKIKTIISIKKKSIKDTKYNIKEYIDLIKSSKKQLKIELANKAVNDVHDYKNSLRRNIKVSTDAIKGLKTELYYDVKELKLYEDEQKRKRKDPKYYVIDFKYIRETLNRNMRMI